MLSTDFRPLCTALVGLQALIEVPEGTDMPFRFAAYRAEFLAAEEINQIGFRYVIGAVTDEMGHTVFAAPLVDGGFADMADLIKLFFCDKVRNLIPIDPFMCAHKILFVPTYIFLVVNCPVYLLLTVMI